MENVDNNHQEIVTAAHQCQILGTFGVFIQALLGLLSFSALIVKRYFEHPKRPTVVWILDTSKQAFSSVLAHFMNMLLAIILSEKNASDNWEWYFINITVDVLLGVFLCYFLLRGLEKLALWLGIGSLNTGNYININSDKTISTEAEYELKFDSGEIDIKVWLLQIIMWGVIVATVKIILFFFQMLVAEYLEFVSKILIGWLHIYPKIKLILIMMIIPFLLNTFQYWIQDNFLKHKKSKDKEFSKFLKNRNRNSEYVPSSNELKLETNSVRSRSITHESRKEILKI